MTPEKEVQFHCNVDMPQMPDILMWLQMHCSINITPLALIEAISDPNQEALKQLAAG